MRASFAHHYAAVINRIGLHRRQLSARLSAEVNEGHTEHISILSCAAAPDLETQGPFHRLAADVCSALAFPPLYLPQALQNVSLLEPSPDQGQTGM